MSAINLIIIGCIIPMTICDLFYGFSEDECLILYEKFIHTNLKSYLLVSGFAQIGIILYSIYEVIRYRNVIMSSIQMLISITVYTIFIMFISVWNMIGAIVFWNNVYGQCSKELSDYLSSSITIKLIIMLCLIVIIKMHE
jgi:hypothetical protein